ncbi:MAG: methylenetetrahydrofolate reductase [NAD(P)H] [Hyphomicrobiales bacterium]|nr:methylenetetrahydrofolate reductase [NAD(P)H] [Hyphomicrobiales bacterium]
MTCNEHAIRCIEKLAKFCGQHTPPSVSFEFFPPKNDEMEAALWQNILQLVPLKPAFVSVTYGAGGSTRERTHHTVKRILQETPLSPAAHLTCVGASREEIDAIAGDYWESGVRHIVALRGDMPGGGAYQPHPDGYPYALDLVKGLKKIGDFEISVAAYPEVHPEAPNPQFDIDYLKRKIDAGATRAITQFFFDTDTYFRFLEQAQEAGITTPIVPGVVPIVNYAQIVRFSKACGASIPAWMHNLLDGMDAYPEQRDMLSFMITAEQCRLLAQGGAGHIHFYTLNRAPLTRAVCHLLGIYTQTE